MADINLSIKVVSTDGSTRTVDLSQGGTLAVKAGDRLILFGPDADKATLVRNGEDLALMIDGQQFFILDGYYALAGDQAAEIITDPAVAATFLTAAEGGLPLLTTPPAETAGPVAAETGVPQVDLVQATAPTLPGDNASARSWRSDDDINLDDPTYRPIVIDYTVEDELIITEGPIPPAPPAPPGPEPVNLPPYFTTVLVTVDEEGNIVTATPDPTDPVDEYNFQMYEFVQAYQPLPNTFFHPPHYEDEQGDYPAGNPYWVGMFCDTSGPIFNTDIQLTSEVIGEIGQETHGPIGWGWGYIPNAFLGWIGVVDPEGDDITVYWDNGSGDGEEGPPGWVYQLSEVLTGEVFEESYDFFGNPIWGLNGEGVLEIYHDTNPDGTFMWDVNAYGVYASILVGGAYEPYSGPWYDYDALAEIYGPTDHFTTTLYATDGINPAVSVPVNFDILDVNEAPMFDQWVYVLDPWNGEGFDNPYWVPYLPQEPPSFEPDLQLSLASEEIIEPAFVPDYELPEGYGIYVGNVFAIDPDFLDQAEYGGQVLYSFMHDVHEEGGDPEWVPYLQWVGDDPDTAGWRAELLDQFSEDGNLWINETTGDIWAANDAWDLVEHSLSWNPGNMPPWSFQWEQFPTNHTYDGPHGYMFFDYNGAEDHWSAVYATAWKYVGDQRSGITIGDGWTPGEGYAPADLAYTEYHGKSGLLVEGKGPESKVDELDADEWLVLNFDRPVLLIDMDLQLFYDNTGKCKPFDDFEWGKYAITSADGTNTLEVYIEANSSDGDFYYEFEHTGYVSSIAFQAGDWTEQLGDWANDFLLHAISYEELPSLDPALVYAHDGRDRLDPIYDGDGNLVYDNDRIYSDLWDASVVLVTDPPSPEDHPILNDQRHWTEESMQTAAPVAEYERCHPIYNIYDGELAEPVFWLGDLIDLDGDAVTYQIVSGDLEGHWMVVYGEGHYEDGIWVDDGGTDTKAYIVANDASTLDYETLNYFDLEVKAYENGVEADSAQVEIWLTNVNEAPWIYEFDEHHGPTQDLYDGPVAPWDFATQEGGEPQPLFEHRDAVAHADETHAGWFGYLGDFNSWDEDIQSPPPPDFLHYSLTGSEHFDPKMGFTAENHPADHHFYLNDWQANHYFDIGEYDGKLYMDDDWCGFEIDELIRGTYEFRVMVHDQGIDGPEYWDTVIVQFEVANHLPDIPCIDDMYESMQTATDYLLDDGTFVNSASIMSDGLVLIGQTTDFDGDDLFYSTSTAGWAIATIGTNVYLAKLNPDQINYEAQNVYNVTVNVTDNIDNATWDLTVNVLNVNETPELDGPSAATLDVTAAVGSVLADFDATDVDNPEVLTYKLLALDGSSFDPNAYFTIDANGVITTIADLADLYVDGAPNEFVFRVVVEDDGGPKADGTADLSGQTASITIMDGSNTDSFLADEQYVTFTLTDNIHGIQYNGRSNFLCDQRLTTEVSVDNNFGDGVHAGFSVSNLGDINGDGFDDFIIGAPLASTMGETYKESNDVSGFEVLGTTIADDFYIADYMTNQFGGDIGVTIDAKFMQGGSWTDTNVIAGWHYESGSVFGLAIPENNPHYIDRQNLETLTFQFTEDVTISGVELIDLWNNNTVAKLNFFNDGDLTHYMTVQIASDGGDKTATVTLYDVVAGTSETYVEDVVGNSGPHTYDLAFEVTTDFIGVSANTSGDHFAVGGFIGGYEEVENTWFNGEAYVIFGDGTWDSHDISTLPFDLLKAVHLDSDPDLGGSGAIEPAEAGFVIHGETGDLASWAMTGFSVANAGDVNGDGIADIFVGAPYVDREYTTELVWVDGEYFSFEDAYGDQKLYATNHKNYRVDNYLPDGNGGWIGVLVDGDEAHHPSGWDDKQVYFDTGDYSFGITGNDGEDDEVDGNYLDERLTFIFDQAVTISGFKLDDVDYNDGGYAVLHLAAGGTQTVDIPDGQFDFHFGEVSVTSVEFFTDGWPSDDYAVDGFYGGGYWEGGETITTHDVGAAYVIFGNAGAWGSDFYLDDLDGNNGFKIIGDDVTENAGWSVHGAMDFDGDGIDDLIIGAPHTDGATAPDYGEVYVVWGDTDWTANGGVLDLDNLGGDGFRIHNKGGSNDYDESGFSVGSMGDINDDGASELVFGVPGDNVSGEATGSVYVLLSDYDGVDPENSFYHQNESAGLWNLWNSQGLAIRLDGENVGDDAGWSVSSAGDIDGDGIDDLIIGAPGHDVKLPDVVVEDYYGFGGASFHTHNSDRDLHFTSFMPNSDGTGTVSVIVSGEENYGGWHNEWVTYNGGELGIDGDRGPDGEIDGNRDERMTFTFSEDVTLHGISLADNSYGDDGTARFYDSSWNVLHTVDIDNGVDDYTFNSLEGVRYVQVWTDGDYGDDFSVDGFYGGYTQEGETLEDVGAAYVVFGSYLEGFVDVDNATIDLGSLDGTNGFKILGDDEGDRLGTSVSGAGDVNGDGIDDIIVGASGDDNDTGEAVIIFGDNDGDAAWSDGVISTEDILTDEATSGVVLEGVDEGDKFGASVSGAGDVNGDGNDDVIVGAPEADGDAGDGGGEAYLILGAPEMTNADELPVEELVQAA